MATQIRKLDNGVSYYFKDGKGPAIFLVHGAGSNHSVWKDVIKDIDNPCIAIDLRGHGYSSPDFNGIKEIVDDILVILKKERLDQVVFAGISVGAFVCYSFAILHPKKVSRLILISPFARNTVRLPRILSFLSASYHAVRSPFSFRRFKRFQDYSKISKKVSMLSPILDISGCSTKTITNCLCTLLKHNIDLSLIPVKTLVFIGEKDVLLKHHVVRCSLPWNASLRYFPCDHLILQHCPEEVVKEIKKFIN